MFAFKLESEIPLLTVTRTGSWSSDTVSSYEAALRAKLAELSRCEHPTCFIIDIRSTGAQPRDVAEALRRAIARLGPIHADRTAVVTSYGLAKLQAKRAADPNSKVFTSMVLARDWLGGPGVRTTPAGTVYDEPSDVEAEGPSVCIHGPSDVNIKLSPETALETAKRIGDAAVEVLLGGARSDGHASDATVTATAFATPNLHSFQDPAYRFGPALT